MRAFFVNLLLVFAALVVGALAIEAVVRAFVGVPKPYALPPRAIALDKQGFWTAVPGFSAVFDNGVDFRDAPVSITAAGARRAPCTAAAGRGPRRVFLIGDSQTFGWGLSDADTWANALQCRLNRRDPGRFRVFNLGVPGTQADEYWSRGIGQVAAAVRPGDVVVVSLTWNDLVTFYVGPEFVTRALAHAGLARDGEGGVRAAASGPNVAPGGGGELAADLVRPVKYLDPPTWRYRLYRDYGVFVPSFNSLKDFGDSMVFVSAAFRVLWQHARLIYYRLRPTGAFFAKLDPEAFKNNFLTVKALAAELSRHGAKVLVQLLPNRLFFDTYYYTSYSKNGVAFPAQDYMGHIAAEYCPKLGLTCVNRFDVLKTDARDAHTFDYDGHYNAAGAARVAEALARDIAAAP